MYANPSVRHSLLLVLALSTVAGCGGSAPTASGSGTGNGGGANFGGGSATGTVSQANPPAGVLGALSSYYVASFTSLETTAAQIRASAKFARQRTAWRLTANGPLLQSDSLAAIRAEYAHAAGLSGAGQTVAVIDAGFLPTHEAFAGKKVTVSGTPAVDNHGTGVASIIAGNSATMTGVAPGANLLLGAWDTPSMVVATQAALTMHAVAQNNSWGYVNAPANQTTFNNVFGNQTAQAYLSALDAYANYGVVLFAVSNDSFATQSGIMDALPALRPSLEPGWLAVANAVPTFDNVGISSVNLQSSGCLQAARWCLLADGAWTSASGVSNTSYQFGTGSSFATPQVAGAMALLAEAFPHLTPHDLRLRLIASANNTFFAADGTMQIVPGFTHDYSNVYGHGFLDLRAALLPIGTTSFSVGGQQVQSTQPLIATGTALGDAVTQSLATVNIAVHDSLAAEFDQPAKTLVATAAPAPLSATLMSAAVGANLTASRVDTQRTAAADLSTIPGRTVEVQTADGGLRAAVMMPDTSGGAGVTITRSIGDGATTVDVGVKLARDAGAMMGFGDAGHGKSSTGMVALELGLRQENSDGSFVSLGGEMGMADLGNPAMLSDVSRAAFNAVGLELGQRNAFAEGDRISLGLSMPMAVTAGSAKIILPVAMAVGGSSVQDVALDLAPTDRQMDLTLAYQTPLGEGRELMMKLVHAENYGNRAGQTDDAAVLAYTFRF